MDPGLTVGRPDFQGYSITVDGIESRRGVLTQEWDDSIGYHPSVGVAYSCPIFGLERDHPADRYGCGICDGSITHTAVGMRWAPGMPILRFTGEGIADAEES